MENYIVIAKSGAFSHRDVMLKDGYLDWRSGSTDFQIGDVAYIYDTQALVDGAIIFKARVTKLGLNTSNIETDLSLAPFVRFELEKTATHAEKVALTRNNLENYEFSKHTQKPLKMSNKPQLEKYVTSIL